MTIKETIQMLERMLDPDPWEVWELSDEVREALEIAVDALEHPENAFTCEGCRYDNREDNPCYDCMREAPDLYEPENSPTQMSVSSSMASAA